MNRRIRRIPRPLATGLTGGALLLSGALLSGCSLLNPTPAEPTRSTVEEEAAVADEVVAALEPLTGEDAGIPDTEELFDTLIEAGYDEEDLETTRDSSPLGNEVPAKMFAVRVDEGCVIGEIRGGEATAELMAPTESTGSCLMGDVIRPEGVDAPSGEERDDDGDDNGAGHIPGEDINRSRTESPAPDDGSASADGGGSGAEGDDSGSQEEPDEGGPAPELGGN